MMSMEGEFSCSFQPWGKVIVDFVLDFQTGIDFHDMEGYWQNKKWHVTAKQVEMEEKGLVSLVFYELLQM